MITGIRHSIELKRRILVISPHEDHRRELEKILSDEYKVENVTGGREALRKLSGLSSYSLCILDLDLPDMKAEEFLYQHRHSETGSSRIPIIAIMDRYGHEAPIIRAGAADFIRTPFQAEVILARCERIIDLSVDQRLIRMAQDDPLTGLYNRNFFFEYVRQIEKNLENPHQDAVVINIEHFHLVNELYGREFGNQSLRLLADIIRSLKTRMDSIACRTDSDCFYIYCRRQANYEALLEEMSRRLNASFREKRIRLRAGVYQDVNPADDPEEWFDRAKKACDRIRQDYTRHISYYDKKLHEKAVFEERLIHELHDALEEKRIQVYFQPKFDITGESPKLHSAEALVRWNHPEFGMIPPDRFIPLFETNGLILTLDRYVWEQAAAEARRWQDAFGVRLPVSVNVSHIDIYDETLDAEFDALIRKYDLTPDLLHLEITESAYAENSERLLNVVRKLREKGFQIEMDDFGSGYSSLNMLSVIPFDVLKLDREFIRNLVGNQKGLRMVKLILDISRDLEVRCVAEGVETEEEYRLLKEMKFDIIQGFYFSKPLSPGNFDQFLARHATPNAEKVRRNP